MSANAAIEERRRAAGDRFAAAGTPHRRIEAWRYTDLRAALSQARADAPAVAAGTVDPFGDADAMRVVFHDGALMETPALDGLPEGVEIVDLRSHLPDWAAARFGSLEADVATPMADAALAAMQGGVAIRVKRAVAAARPVHLAFEGDGADERHVRVLIVLEAGVSLTLLTHAAAGGGSLSNLAYELFLGRDAALTEARVTEEAAGVAHVSTSLARLEQGAGYEAAILTGGGAMTRHELHVALTAPQARVKLTALAALGAREHVDVTAVIDHAATDTTSDLAFRNVLDGRSRGVAQGRILVREGANGADSVQNTRALLLSPLAEADAKPELEIFADDVVCGHGAAIGDLDADALFYLRARGIPEPEARAMLTEAFLEEALTRLPEIAAEPFRARIVARLRRPEAAA